MEIREEKKRSFAIMLNCAATPIAQSSNITPVMIILESYNGGDSVFECTGIEFHPDRKWPLSSLGVQDIIIRNISGIEVESPKSHHVTDVKFEFPDEVLLHTNRLVYFRPNYPRAGPMQRIGRAEYITTVSSKHIIEDNIVRLNQAAAFMIPFTIPRVEGSSLHNDCEFAIIVKAAAPRPKIGIWRWNERSDAHDTWKQAMTKLLMHINWDGERKYPSSARTSLDEVVRIGIRYSVSTRAHDCLEAVLDITIEGNDASLYIQDARDNPYAQSTGVHTQNPLLVAPMPAVAPLRIKRNDLMEVVPTPKQSDADTGSQKADPFEDILEEFSAVFISQS